MKFVIKGTRIKLNPKLEDYIKDRIGSTEKYINTDLPLTAKVEIEKVTDHHNKGKIFRAEVNIHLKNKFLRVETTREDIYLAINETRDDLKREFKKYKETLIDKQRRVSKEKRRAIL